MKHPKPTDPAETLALPQDELAARRTADPDEVTAVLRRPTVRELEQRLFELPRKIVALEFAVLVPADLEDTEK